MIPIKECKDGYLYAIFARHAMLGLYVAKKRGFRISRFKFGDNYEFVEYHWDTGEPYGTAKAYKELFKPEEFKDEQDFLAFMNSYYKNHYEELRDILRKEDPELSWMDKIDKIKKEEGNERMWFTS